MILVDTPIWIDHLNRGDPAMSELLERNQVLIHPFVIGEVALGSLRDRTGLLRQLGALNFSALAYDAEVIDFIGRNGLGGSGIGYVDAHLLVSVRLTEEACIWTRDRRLEAAALKSGTAHRPNDSLG